LVRARERFKKAARDGVAQGLVRAAQEDVTIDAFAVGGGQGSHRLAEVLRFLVQASPAFLKLPRNRFAWRYPSGLDLRLGRLGHVAVVEPDLVDRDPAVPVVDDFEVCPVAGVHLHVLAVPLELAAGVDGEGDPGEQDAVVDVHRVAVDDQPDLATRLDAGEAVVDRVLRDDEAARAEDAAEFAGKLTAVSDASLDGGRRASARVPFPRLRRRVPEGPPGGEPVTVVSLVERLEGDR
jgi:hypothetical protein